MEPIEAATAPGRREADNQMQQHTAAHVARLAIGAAVVIGLGVALLMTDLDEAQRATSFTGLERGEVRGAAVVDFVFLVAYALWTSMAFWRIRDGRTPRRSPEGDDRPLHPVAVAGVVLIWAGAAADAVENVLLAVALEAERPAGVLGFVRAAGLVKWGLVTSALVTLAALVLLRSWRPPLPVGHPRDVPERDEASGSDPERDWAPPPADGNRVGICLSGGGIRSAAFCLGAMQALRKNRKLAGARYLTAVSGGGYLAAGWAVSHAGPPGDQDSVADDRWAPGSPEERWFRDHASYLVPDFKRGMAGVGRLLSGVAVNLVLLALVLFVVARPVGWVIHEAHPALRAVTPTPLVRDAEAAVQAGAVRFAGTLDGGGSAGRIERYEIDVQPLMTDAGGAAASPAEACSDVWRYDPDDRDVCAPVVQQRPALVEVQNGRMKLVAQPKVGIGERRNGPDCDQACQEADILRVQEQPRLVLTDDVFVARDVVASQVEVGRQPRVATKAGLAAQTYPEFRSWMWQLPAGLAAAAALVALTTMSIRSKGRRHAAALGAAAALASTAAVVFVVVVGLPWLVVALPRWLASLTTSKPTLAGGSGGADYLLPSGGVLALVLTAARQYLASDKTGAGAGAARPWYRRLPGALAKRRTELKWYESSPSKVVVLVVIVLATVVSFVNFLQFAVGNGWSGRLMGMAFVRDRLPWWMFWPEWAKLLVVTAGLAMFALLADAHAWSLYPFYKRRLSSAFLLRRKDHHGASDNRDERFRAEEIPYDDLLPFNPGSSAEWGGMASRENGPQLVACCAVNLSEYGRVPPGRRAASFTFSSTEIGGPVVGYVRAGQYWDNLPGNRRRDITVPSAMAISGAAFAPAMGKFNLGPVGSVLALANLRLGVWLPHPCRARDPERRDSEWNWRWFRRPHWIWFLRELTNTYAFNRRYLYVSDGGHWDNLGLVELLRRGCTEIYCVSGAGDGALSFGTIGEAIALAREELGVEIDLDPSDLRAPTKAPDDPPARELRRAGVKDEAATYAAKPAVAGRITYPNGRDGVIHYVEATLTPDMPFDVHTFAEAETVFPDDSTGDQVFNHRQFESYRALGYHQTMRIFRPPSPFNRRRPATPPGSESFTGEAGVRAVSGGRSRAADPA